MNHLVKNIIFGIKYAVIYNICMGMLIYPLSDVGNVVRIILIATVATGIFIFIDGRGEKL